MEGQITDNHHQYHGVDPVMCPESIPNFI